MGPFAPDAVIGGRYRLTGSGPAGTGEAGAVTERWAATDTVLARPVLVVTVPADSGRNVVAAFTAAAASTGRLVHPGILATYDSGVVDGLPYLVTERPGGVSLHDLVVRHGPLPPERVIRIGRQVARALEVAHRIGAVHGDLRAEFVIVGDDDRVTLAGFAAGATRSRLAAVAPHAVDDVIACGAILRAAAAPGSALDEVLAAVGGAITTAGDLATALEGIERRTGGGGAAGRVPRGQVAAPSDVGGPATPPSGTAVLRPPRAGMAAGISVGVALAVAAAIGGFLLVSRSHSGGGGSSPTTLPSQARGGGLAIANATSFNPLGSGPEHPELLGQLSDGDPSTSWTTQTYASQHFGGLKAGTGVIIGLQGSHRLEQLTVDSPSRGWTFSVYVASQQPTALAGWGSPVASVPAVESAVTQVSLNGTEGSFVLVWITQLTDAAPYRVAIGELALR